MKILKSIGLALLAIILLAIPVLAYTYTSSISVVESNGTTYDYLPLIMDMDNAALINQGFMLPTGLDTQVISSTDWPHMLTPDKVIWAAPISPNATNYFQYTLGNTPPLTQLSIVVGNNGYIVTGDDADLEIDTDGHIEVAGYVDTQSGGRIVSKADSIIIEANAGNITATITQGGGDIVLTGAVASGLHTVELAYTTWDANEWWLEVDSVVLDHDFGTDQVDNANDWEWNLGNAMPYMEYIEIDLAGVGIELSYIVDDIIESNTLPDQGTSGCDGTITFGSNPAGIAISAGYLHDPSISSETVGVTNPDAPDIISAVTQPGWFNAGSPNANDPFYMLANTFSAVAAAMPNPQNIPAQFIARLFAIIIMLVSFILTAKYLKHVAIACIVGTALAGLFHAWGGYWPFLFVFFLILVCVGTAVLEARGTI